ncbi:MAG: PD-(D/E)XK nuclease family protein [Ignavibacteriales bacterium]|nr:PD-(D/E)XK nuclease family protein [Ignavibacteriales bacterium]
MSTVRLLPPGSDLMRTICDLLQGGGRDYSDSIVVFPEKRPAHFLRKAMAGRIGGSFLPPRIFSMDSHLCRHHLALEAPLLSTVDAVALLHDIHCAMPLQLGAGNNSSLDSFAPIALRIYEELEELRTAQMSAERLAQSLSYFASKELPVMFSLYSSFYAEVERRGALTPGMLYAAAAEGAGAIDLSVYNKIILAGFFTLAASEQKIFRVLAELPQTVCLFQEGEGLAEQLDLLGIGVPEAPSDEAPAPVPDIHLYECPDTHGQAFALGGILDAAAKAGNVLDDRTVIALPAVDSLFPVLHHALSDLDEKTYNVSLGYPVSRTPVFGFLSTLLEVLSSAMEGRYEAATYAKFILHPYTKNIRWKKRSDITRIIFQLIEEELIENRTLSFFALEDIENNAELISRIALRCHGIDESVDADGVRNHIAAIHSNTIRHLAGQESVGGMARHAADVLRYIVDESTARRHPLFRPFAQTLLDVLESLAQSLLADKKFDDPGALCAFLRTMISVQTVPFSGTPLQGLQVLGFLETRNIRFDTVYLLDANDDVLPGPKGIDVLLPVSVREYLGLRTYRTQEKINAYAFDILVHGAARVHCFFVQKGKKERSRFLERILWEKQKNAGRTETAPFIPSLSYALSLHGTQPPPVEKSVAMIDALRSFNYSATALDAYLRCGLKFYYRYVLKLKEKETTDDEIESTEIGTFVHTVLCDYFRKYAGAVLTPELFNQDALEELIDQRFSEEYGNDPVGPVYLMKVQVRKKLLEFLDSYQIPAVRGHRYRLIDVEQTITVSIKGFSLRGKVDRIEERDGKSFIFDYKTSADDKYLKIDTMKLVEDDRGTWGDAIGSLQLPFYAMLYAGHSGIPLDSIVPAFIFLGRRGLDTSIEVRLFEENGKEELEKYERIIMALLEEIVSPENNFLPTTEFEEECGRCEFCALCGTQWAV